MAWTVYILRCGDGSLYTGSTTDMNRRLKEHQSGRGGAYTRSRRPLALAWTRQRRNRSSAQRLEAFIKGRNRKEKEELLSGLCGVGKNRRLR